MTLAFLAFMSVVLAWGLGITFGLWRLNRRFPPPPPIKRNSMTIQVSGSGGAGGSNIRAYGCGGQGDVIIAYRLGCCPPEGANYLIFGGNAYRKLDPSEVLDFYFFAPDGSRWVEIPRPLKVKAL